VREKADYGGPYEFHCRIQFSTHHGKIGLQYNHHSVRKWGLGQLQPLPPNFECNENRMPAARLAVRSASELKLARVAVMYHQLRLGISLTVASSPCTRRSNKAKEFLACSPLIARQGIWTYPDAADTQRYDFSSNPSAKAAVTFTDALGKPLVRGIHCFVRRRTSERVHLPAWGGYDIAVDRKAVSRGRCSRRLG